MQIWSLLSNEWQVALENKRAQILGIGNQLTYLAEINPKPENIFRALGSSPKDFRVVVVGQDPYPEPRFAMGLAFSIPNNETRVPPSLKNIQAEFKADLNRDLAQDLTPWSRGGVLLLNRILTCRAGESLSHKDLGWQEITDEIVRAVVKQNPNAVGILWGNRAKELTSFFKPSQIISSAHPSPLSARHGFFGSKPFSKANELLQITGQEPINW